MIPKIQGLVLVRKIQKSTLLQHKPADVEGKVLPYLEESVSGDSYLCIVSNDNGEATGLESIEKEDTDQNETIKRILKGVFEVKYQKPETFSADFLLKKAKDIAAMTEKIND